MRVTHFAAIALTVAMGASSAFATPSTLVWIPSTDIQAAGVVHLGYDTYTTPGSGSGNFTDYGITYGIGGAYEIGVDYWTGTDDPWVFNAKGRVLQETASQPALVVGAYNFAGNDTSGQNVVYVIAGKTFSGTRFTAGYGWGRGKVLGPDHNMLLLGVDRTLDERWWIGADYQGGDSALGAFNLGVSYKFAPNASVIVGYDWYNSSDIKDTFNVQVDVDLVKF